MITKHVLLTKKLVVVGLLLFLSTTRAFGQNVSTEGTDFWLGFMPHMTLNNLELSIFISAKDTVNGSIFIPGNPEQKFTISPNSTTEIVISPSDWADVVHSRENAVRSKGIHIVTDNRVSVYELNKRNVFSADATIVLPTVSLGKEYYAVTHTDSIFTAPNGNTYTSYPASFLVVGVVDNTQIEITPTKDLIGGQPGGVPFTITLNQGQTYLVQSLTDITGTRLATLNGSTGDCSNFAVFSGCERTYVGKCGAGQDHLIQQMYPTKAWGKDFIFVPYQQRRGGDLIKIVASEDATTVNISGEPPVILNDGDSYQGVIDGVRTITSDQPISVTQFSKSADCDGALGDPFMIALSPNQQLLNKITFSAFPVFSPNDFTYYVDIISPTAGVNGMILDGTNIGPQFNVVPGNPAFSYAQIVDLDTGNHLMQSDSGFIAYVYGFGTGSNAFESFGYATGASLNNINFSISSIDSGQFIIENTSDLCFGNEIDFSSNLDTTFKIFAWDMGDGTTYTTSDVEHTYTASGEYNVTLIASTSSGDCGSQQSISKVVNVQIPEYDLYGPRSVCPDAMELDYWMINVGAEDYDYVWEVSGGALVSGQGEDSIKVNWFGTNPSAYIKVTVNDNIGCVSSKTFPVRINRVLDPEMPSGPDSVCYNDLTQVYEAIFANGNVYEWYIEGGTLAPNPSDVNGNTTLATWDTTATEWKIWFEESNVFDTLCTGVSDTFFLKTILPEFKANLQVDPISCFGEVDGSIALFPSGGVGGYTFTWQQDTSIHVSALNNLGAGIYIIEVQDTFGCTILPEVELIEPDPLVLSFDKVNVLCFDDSSGNINITIAGGTEPFQYDWGSMSSLDTAFLDSIPMGNYQVNVTDANGCKVSSPQIIIREPDPLSFTLSGPDSVCQFSSGKGYTVTDDDNDTYFWLVEGGTIEGGQGTKNISVTWGGDNTNAAIKVVAQNSDGCTSDTVIYDVLVFEFPQPAAPIGIDSLCLHDTLGIQYTTGFTTGHDYNWFIEGGNLTIDPSDINGTTTLVDWQSAATRKIWFQEFVTAEPVCNVYSDTLTVIVLPEVTGEMSFTPVSCFEGSDGTATATISGGNADYTYTWSHDATLDAATVTGLTSSIYDVHVEDGIGCEIDLSVEVIEPSSALVIDQLELIDIVCHGDSTGEIEITTFGGIPPYVLTWDDPNTTLGNEALNLPAGTYHATLVDSFGCVEIDTFTIAQPDSFTYVLDTIPSSCRLTDGVATINVSGATSPFHYDWLTTSIYNGNTGENLAPGSNMVVVTDSSGCSYNVDAYINNKPPEIYYPNTFTPNGDDTNEEFKLIYTCDGEITFTIYNRWGDVIFQSFDMDKGWKGTSDNGQEMPSGLYPYRIVYKTTLDGRSYTIEKLGGVMLIR